ncbi:hypothetical protein F8A10_07660 [Paracoccus kondratievae]|uniref:SGNH/GDSL hydrolase family protein n=1 Tax=Paracoccus kondratievae TaxID=135740 RepID=UPI00126645DE|nr:SGNH/GDSL hydrolase family protein [Paracoccus kondratievae]QFQ87309.1 hypothetical protein F8A10_07660 [Paracoccus kondratievae]
MAVTDDINIALRDFERYTGDGLPNAPVGHPLPVGDPRSGVHHPNKAELRNLLITIAQTMGDPDALDEIVAATGAPLASFRLPLIHDPWGVKSGGVHTIYVPRHGYVRRGDQVLNGIYGTPSTPFPDHVALPVTSDGAATVYIDLLDTTNPYKITNWPETPPTDRPSSIVVVAEIYRQRIKTEFAMVKLEDPDQELISFRWPIVVDGGKVRFGGFYHYSSATGWTFYQPPAPEAYWELDLNTLNNSHWRYYVDRVAAAAGEVPIKVANGGSTRPLVLGNQAALIEIGTSINSMFQTVHPVIGGQFGAPNMMPLGNDPDRAPRYHALTTAVDLTDPALLARGLTRGFGGMRPMPRLRLPPDTPRQGWIFVRVCVQVAADDDFASPTIYLQSGDSRNLAQFSMLMERRLSARAAVYTRIVPYNVAETPEMLTVGYTTEGRITAGHQYYIGPLMGAIQSGDFASAGTEDILLPPELFVVEGRDLPIWRDGIVPDREGPGRVNLRQQSAPVGVVPWSQPIIGHAVPDYAAAPSTIGISVSGSRYSQSFRAERTVSVNRISGPVSGAVKVLCMGDSITNRELPSRVSAALADIGMTPEMIGTMANDGGAWGEGRGAWEYGDFIGIDTQFPAVPVGDEADYLAMDATNANADGRWGRNPFLRPATGGDNPAHVFNGLIFDFPAYLSRFGVDVPDYVTLQLGTNDINQRAPAVSLDQITRGLAVMVPSILAASPTIRVGVSIPPLPRSPHGDGKWTGHMVAAIRAIMAECAKHARADCVPVWAHMSPDFGWVVSARQTRDGRVVGDIGDELHPIDANLGYMADAWAQWIACRAI